MINLLARLGLDTSGFATGLAKAEVHANKAGKKIGGAMRNQFAAVFGTAAIAASIKSVMDFGGKIADMADKSSISKQALQEFDYAAQQTGTSLEAFVTAEKKLAQAQIAAIGGSKEMTEVFARMGLSVDDLKRLNPHQLFTLVSGAIGKAGVSSQTLSDTLKLMGRSADELLPAMKQGFEAMADRAHKLGLILSDEVIDKMDEAGDRLSEAKMRLRAPAASLAMAGVSTLENVSAVGAGLSAVLGAIRSPFAEGKGQSLKDIYTGAVDAYNQQVMDSVGSKSLVPLLQKQVEKLDQIVSNTMEGGDELGL